AAAGQPRDARACDHAGIPARGRPLRPGVRDLPALGAGGAASAGVRRRAAAGRRRGLPATSRSTIRLVSTDFMPLDGWDHVELWVGNAKQSAYFYEHAFGFTRTAYAGPETGVRDRASYVLEQGDIRLIVTSGLRTDSEITQFACRHGDAARTIALRVQSAADADRQAGQRRARVIGEAHC